MLAASVKLLTSFAASGQDQTGTGLATAISKLTNVMREERFAGVLRQLNQADFLASMSCLVEMSSENYCTTRDSKLLFDEMMKQLQTRPRNEEAHKLGVSHPLAGYYILTQNLPMISNWIQRIQIGVDPKLPTDATFQNKVFDEVNNFYKKMKVIQGSFSMDVQAMRVIPELSSRKNAARLIVQKLNSILNEDAFSQMGADGLRNFFTLNGSSKQIPFMLMGIDMPDVVKGIGYQMQDPMSWLEANYSTLPAFSDPEALIATVDTNLNKMIEAAKINAREYYNKWFIVDKISLVNESLLGTNYTVKESFQLTSDYLAQVESRLISNNGERSIIASIQDTRTKIKHVMDAYADLEKLSASLSSGGETLSVDDRNRIASANLAIIAAVYDEFEVLLGKSGWFSNRIVKFVYADYLLMLKKQNNLDSNLDDLFYATGLSLFDQIVASAGGNPAKVQNDFSLALRLNKMNLDAVEDLVGGYFAATTASLKDAARAGSDPKSAVRGGRTNATVWDRAYREGSADIPGDDTPKWIRVTRGFFSAMTESIKNLPTHVPLWSHATATSPQYVVESNKVAVDDEFGSARRMYEQFCIQSLAFGHVRTFFAMCKNTVLKSPFADNFLSNLSEAQRKELSVSYNDKLLEARENPQLNASKRICAFRDYNRKNLVMYLTSGQAKK